MKVYHDLVQRVLDHGVRKKNRTGTDTISNFAECYKVNLSEGFPLLTTKKVFFKSVILELLWYLRGEDHIRWLRDKNNVHIWDAWADEAGHVGPIYPVLWRRFPFLIEHKNEDGTTEWRQDEFDQIKNVIHMLKTDPMSRRIVVSAWHPGLLPKMALPPCHIMYIFNVSEGKLNCHLTQRSGDIALGIPFNLACYSTLTMAIAQEVGLEPGVFAHTIVDAHIYVNHIDGLKQQLLRQPKTLPELKIANKPVDKLSYDDFELIGYDPDPSIRFEVAV